MPFVTSNGTIQAPSNCGLTPVAIDDGGNVSHDAGETCNLGGVHADPQLAAALDGSQPPVLTIPANSSAVDIAACGARTFDQRGVAAPAGPAVRRRRVRVRPARRRADPDAHPDADRVPAADGLAHADRRRPP